MGYSNKNKECTCAFCNCTFLSFKKTTKFCSPKCNNMYIYQHRDINAYNERKRSKSAAKARKNRYHNDSNFRLSCVLRARLKAAINNNHKVGSAVRDLGCSIEELKKYLEAKFKPGMTWENYGRFGWHIDHIVPLTSFNLSDYNQVIKVCHYTNLQPMWWRENIIKGGAK